MEFLEDEPRPRFLLQPATAAFANTDNVTNTGLKTTKLHAALCLFCSSLLLLSALRLSPSSQTLSFLFAWASLSLILGPFAPVSLTGGDVRVGLGEALDDPDPTPDEPDDAGRRRRSRPQRPDPPPALADYVAASSVEKVNRRSGEGGEVEVEEREWSEEDFEILRKQMVKHPVGTARRWELIAGAFGSRHGVKSVISAAKSMAERRPGAVDSFQQFLRKRKLVDSRVEGGGREPCDGVALEAGDGKGSAMIDANGSVSWSSGEDLALLNALKAFPKDVAMRWEKIAAAVPGKSKAGCMKRVAELKRDFRSTKTSEA